MKINTELELKTLDGKKITTPDGDVLTVGKTLANILLSPREDKSYEFDKMKLFILANKFYNEKEVEIDASDLKKIENLINSSETFGPSICGQVLIALEELKKK